jgi:type IV pilus assembly protein PilA
MPAGFPQGAFVRLPAPTVCATVAGPDRTVGSGRRRRPAIDERKTMTPHVTDLTVQPPVLQGRDLDAATEGSLGAEGAQRATGAGGAGGAARTTLQAGTHLAPAYMGRVRWVGRAGAGPGRHGRGRTTLVARNASTRHAHRSARPVQRRPRDEDGFTLVELLVVVLVLGALIGIAVPTFVSQRDGAWDAAVRSELRAAGIALESYRAQNGEYSVAALAPGAGWGYEDSGDLVLEQVVSASSYCMIASHREAGGSEPNRWRITQAGLESEPVGTSATCGATSGSGS